MSVSRPLSAAAALVLLAAAVPHAPAAAAATVSQGQAVRVNDRFTCTVGFNAPDKGWSYTAGHCGNAGARVSTVDGTATGTFTPSRNFSETGTGNDWGLIIWDAGVKLGPNNISGDTVADPAGLEKGQRVCFYGTASGQMRCGSYAGALGNNVYFDAPDGVKGDSGGPVWAPNRGFLGVYSGASAIWDDAGREVRLGRASQPVNGKAVSEAEEIALLGDYGRAGKPTAHAAYVPGEAAAGAAGRLAARAQQRSSESGSSLIANSGSSDNESLPVIVAIVVGVLVASIPLLLAAAGELAPLYLPTSAP